MTKKRRVMTKKRFPWDCGNCPMLDEYDSFIDGLTYRCLLSKCVIKDYDRYRSANCPMEEHDKEIRAKAIEDCIAFVKEHSSEHYVDCDRFSGELEEIFRLDYYQDEFEMLKEKRNGYMA